MNIFYLTEIMFHKKIKQRVNIKSLVKLNKIAPKTFNLLSEV
jgi:hypothetical protein